MGRAPCEAFLLPCVERCLSDSSDEVVAWALKCLGDMVGAPSSDSSRSHPEKENQPAPPFEANQHIEGNGSVLQKRSVVAAAQRAAPALCHPAGAIRKSARRFFSAAARFLGRADTFALLLPAVRPFMRDGLSAGLSGSVCAAVDVIGDEDALRAALRHGAPTGSRPSGGMSALHIAASHPNTAEHSLELVQALLEAKADADVADSEGLKAVHAAAAVGRTNVVEALIGATCPDDGVDAKDWNASSVQKTVQAKLRAMGAPRAEDVGITAEGAAAAAKQISETCVPHDVPTEVKDAAVAAKTKREGDEAFIKGDNVNAIDKYTQSLDADGTNEKVWANRAAAKLKLKDFHGALRDARTAKVIDCDYVKAWFREGSALTELGDYENAALCFFEGMQVEGQSENPDLKRGFDDAIKKGRDALGKK